MIAARKCRREKKGEREEKRTKTHKAQGQRRGEIAVQDGIHPIRTVSKRTVETNGVEQGHIETSIPPPAAKRKDRGVGQKNKR